MQAATHQIRVWYLRWFWTAIALVFFALLLREWPWSPFVFLTGRFLLVWVTIHFGEVLGLGGWSWALGLGTLLPLVPWLSFFYLLSRHAKLSGTHSGRML